MTPATFLGESTSVQQIAMRWQRLYWTKSLFISTKGLKLATGFSALSCPLKMTQSFLSSKLTAWECCFYTLHGFDGHIFCLSCCMRGAGTVSCWFPVFIVVERLWEQQRLWEPQRHLWWFGIYTGGPSVSLTPNIFIVISRWESFLSWEGLEMVLKRSPWTNWLHSKVFTQIFSHKESELGLFKSSKHLMYVHGQKCVCVCVCGWVTLLYFVISVQSSLFSFNFTVTSSVITHSLPLSAQLCETLTQLHSKISDPNICHSDVRIDSRVRNRSPLLPRVTVGGLDIYSMILRLCLWATLGSCGSC